MKLKSTLGLAIGSLLAVSSFGVFAQGQGAVEAEVFAKRYFTDSYRDMDNGNLYGGSVGYFLTDDVSLNLSYGEYKRLNHDNPMPGQSRKARGSLTALDAVYHFGTPGVGLRPYISAGMGHQSLTQKPASGRDHTTFASREAFDAALAAQVQVFTPALVVLAGFMRILSPTFVDQYTGRLLNIHPSLLPAFPGLHTHARAIEAGCRFAGASVHQVTSQLDVGPILDQAVVPVLPGDTPETLAGRVLTQEHLLYPRAVRQFLSA